MSVGKTAKLVLAREGRRGREEREGGMRQGRKEGGGGGGEGCAITSGITQPATKHELWGVWDMWKVCTGCEMGVWSADCDSQLVVQ